MKKAVFKEIPITSLSLEDLENLSNNAKLGLSREDMIKVQSIYQKWKREPTDVELEMIAQTWSEHCKHRIFGANIEHQVDGKKMQIKGLFETYIKEPSERIFEKKPDFVLSAFHDNAGFIRLDENYAVCLKVETHNHPSAIEPYSGSSTGLGGVIRDILAAGKGAKPIASLDVFCLGNLEECKEKTRKEKMIHPLGILRGVVKGIRDYGNRMGIPTVTGAIQFDENYLYNPLVFCGAAGVIPIQDIEKKVFSGLKVIVVGARTGRDGLKGATFSSASLSEDTEGQSAIQVGAPIEEKKVLDFVLQAREQNLIECITDCGAGGFSSSIGEMLSESGGNIFLEKAPLKEKEMTSWEIFLSESQERIIFAAKQENIPKLEKLAVSCETEVAVLGEVNETGRLKVSHYGEIVCDLDLLTLHDAPNLSLFSSFSSDLEEFGDLEKVDFGTSLKKVLSDPEIASKESVIQQYDHTVQGNTLLSPLAGASGIAPQDGSIIRIPHTEKAIAISLSLLPDWGKKVPYSMGQATVDEVMRQLTVLGANPNKVGLLDNFSMGNPHDSQELGKLVECIRGMSSAAIDYEAPFISGKDSFYNFYKTKEKTVNIPVTFLCSGIGIVDSFSLITGNSLRREDTVLCLLGETQGKLGCSVFERLLEEVSFPAPFANTRKYFNSYLKYYQALKQGLIVSAHDVSEGGIAISAIEMAFSGKGGIELELETFPVSSFNQEFLLFDESPGRILIECEEENVKALTQIFSDHSFAMIGKVTKEKEFKVKKKGEIFSSFSLSELEKLWREGFAKLYHI